MNTPAIPDHPLLHRALQQTRRPAQPSGHAALDAALHEGGWPLGAVTELLAPLPGLAELWLLAPALRASLELPGWLVLVTPPGLPHAPAWQALGLPCERLLILRPDNPRDWLWSVEQAAKAGMPAVLAWPGRVALNGKSLRRLQLAAETGGRLLMISRRPQSAREASPAALRLHLAAQGSQLQVDILKQRGSWGGQSLMLDLPFRASPTPPVDDWGKTPVPQTPATPRRGLRLVG